MVTEYQDSPSGYYEVTLLKLFKFRGFTYKPSASKIVVDETVLVEMITDEAVASVNPAPEA